MDTTKEHEASDWKRETHFEEELRFDSGRFRFSSSSRSILQYMYFMSSSLRTPNTALDDEFEDIFIFSQAGSIGLYL